MEQTNIGRPVKYVSAGTDCQREEVFLPASFPVVTNTAGGLDAITFKVLTPAFYTRFVQYAHPSELIDNELLAGEEKNRTFWISSLEPMSQLFGKPKNTESVKEPFAYLTSLDRTRWLFLKNLRTSPKRQSQGELTKPGVQPIANATDIRMMPLSPLDNFVLGHCTSADTRQYRRIVTKVLVSNYIAFGFPEILDLGDLLFRLLLCSITIQGIGGTLTQNPLSAASSDSHSPSEIFELAILACYSNSLHIWALVKSFL